MSIKIIPEQEIVTCDRCHNECSNNSHNHKNEAMIKFYCKEMDAYLHYKSMPTRIYDLCDDCFVEFQEFMKGLSGNDVSSLDE